MKKVKVPEFETGRRTMNIKDSISSGKENVLEKFFKEDVVVVAPRIYYMSHTLKSNILSIIKDEFIKEEELEEYYIFKPEKYCLAKYGEPKMSTIILFLNEMTSPEEFDREKIKYLTEDGVKILLDNI